MEHAASATPIAALESSSLAVAMRHDVWLYPIVEIVHISGFVVLVGSIVVLDLRLLGLSRSLSVGALARHVLPWSVGALMVIVPSGFLMFTAHASDFISNPAFQLKIALILTGLTNAAVFHTGAFRPYANAAHDAPVPAMVRAHAAASLAIWFSVIACGRLLAYL